jgi:hypothetical protein
MFSQEYNSVCQTLNKDKNPDDKKNVKDQARENKVDEKMSKNEKLDAKKYC